MQGKIRKLASSPSTVEEIRAVIATTFGEANRNSPIYFEDEDKEILIILTDKDLESAKEHVTKASLILILDQQAGKTPQSVTEKYFDEEKEALLESVDQPTFDSMVKTSKDDSTFDEEVFNDRIDKLIEQNLIDSSDSEFSDYENSSNSVHEDEKKGDFHKHWKKHCNRFRNKFANKKEEFDSKISDKLNRLKEKANRKMEMIRLKKERHIQRLEQKKEKEIRRIEQSKKRCKNSNNKPDSNPVKGIPLVIREARSEIQSQIPEFKHNRALWQSFVAWMAPSLKDFLTNSASTFASEHASEINEANESYLKSQQARRLRMKRGLKDQMTALNSIFPNVSHDVLFGKLEDGLNNGVSFQDIVKTILNEKNEEYK